jgi:uncharacterized protein YukE
MVHINVDELRVNLDAYQRSLEKQVTNLRTDFHDLDLAWQALNSCYGGTSAEEFQQAWSETAEWFQQYIQCVTAMAIELRTRIEHLAHL